jgi:hypothetical protein
MWPRFGSRSSVYSRTKRRGSTVLVVPSTTATKDWATRIGYSASVAGGVLTRGAHVDERNCMADTATWARICKSEWFLLPRQSARERIRVVRPYLQFRKSN